MPLSPEYNDLPESLRGGMQRYIEQHILPGSFLSAVLSNDLREACERADVHNRVGLWNLVAWLYNNAPGDSWGSPEHVRLWVTPMIDAV